MTDRLQTWRRARALPFVVGLGASILMLLFYLGLVSLISQSWDHALSLLADDRWFVAPIVAGLGIQAGLFTHLRRLHRGMKAPAAVTGSSAGMSTAAMVACCAHHVTDVLPLIGLSGAAILLAEYKVPFMVVGLLSNLAGIGYLLVHIRRAGQHQAGRALSTTPACHAPSGPEAAAG
ncbi:MAG TPA: hypothetical protein VLC95_11145 [Anaerolineae bacterium]|nr:hypothetical protein [Anaerolineae bacterium]